MIVTAVHRAAEHTFAKTTTTSIQLIAGQGVSGDAHCGPTVRHRSRVTRDPAQPNLRQVHLIHAELFDELQHRGFAVAPGQLGENITTRGIDLLALSAGTQLRIGDEVLIEVTGLRNPCHQIEDSMPGLLAAVLERGPDGAVVRKTGVMGIVVHGGTIAAGTPIVLAHIPAHHAALVPV
ncbi:MAG: MOSC domain-containing protein [Chloroflexi bacterium]|nr:MOSC domain-containing protein [Chloroflexota bacterium]